MHGAMDFDLALKLVLGTRLLQSSFGYNFDSLDSVLLQVSDLVYLGEATFSKEVTLDVALDMNLAARCDCLLFDYLMLLSRAWSLALQTDTPIGMVEPVCRRGLQLC